MYDVIVVGARCAGSPTALLLARAGLRVLVVDKATFPSDTLSTHFIHQPGVACLQRWGVLDRVAASGCPPVLDYVVDVGPFALRGRPAPAGDVAEAYCVRRTVLDTILLEAAAAAGAEVRTGFGVEEILVEDGRVTGIRGRTPGGPLVTERARVVVGADGRRSVVARAVDAETYDAAPSLTCAFYTYWEGVDVTAAELYPRPGTMLVTAPTNDGLVVTIAFWPAAAFGAVRQDVAGHLDRVLEAAPSLAARVREGARADRFRGTAQLANAFRRPWGDGWALVGDAGHHKDPIMAYGITDAFLDAESLAGALADGLSGRAPLPGALGAHAVARDARLRHGYATTLEFARLEPPPAERVALLTALRDDAEGTSRFLGTLAGTVAPEALALAA